MKKMLPLLIGLLLVGAAAWYFLKKKNVKTTVPTGGESGNSSKFLDLNDTDSIIDSLSLSSSLNSAAKGWVKTINKDINAGNNNWSRSAQEAKAKNNGFTYSQQMVMSALWQMYETSKSISIDQYRQYESELESLGE